MPTYLDFESDNNAIEGHTHKFQTSILEADHPPMGDISNRVATTGWVNSLMEGNPMYPQVIQASNLSVNVSEGYINNLEGEPILIPATLIPISVVGGTTEYVYIRYSDMKPVISTIQPSNIQGFILANVVSDQNKILEINKVTPNPMGWASSESPTFTGDPQAPTPPQGDYDNSIATTQWVKDELASVLGTDIVNRPTVTLSPPSTLIWSSGTVNIEGTNLEIQEGVKVFGIADNGTYTVRGVLQPGPVGIIQVTTTPPNNPYTNLASVNVSGGVLGDLQTINPSVPLGDLSNTYSSTQYLFDTLMAMSHGIAVPRISISADKTMILWTSGQVSINAVPIDINEGSTTTTRANGYYYLYALSTSDSLELASTLPAKGYKALSKVEIFSNQVKGIYPIMPGFGI